MTGVPSTAQSVPEYQETFRILRRLSAIDVDLAKNIGPLLREIVNVTGGRKLCIVCLRGDSGTERAFCQKDETCASCGDISAITGFSRRSSARFGGMAKGDAVLSTMTAEEKARFRFTAPIFMPIVYEGELYGSLSCDNGDVSAWTPALERYLGEVCDMLAITFHNAAFYQGHLRQQQTLTRILENLDANIYVSDMENNEILFINKKMRDEFGIADDCIGEQCWRVLQEGMAGPCGFCPAPRLCGNPGEMITWEEHNSATGMHYRNTDSVIEWLDGRMVHLQHSVNITDEKEINKNLEEAKKMAESANQAKSDFLSRMSHEIRTPINAIIGMTRIARGADDMGKVKQCLEKVDASSKQLLNVINDILDMSKITANKMSINVERFDFERMLIDITNVISVWAAEKRQKLHIRMDVDMPRFYMGDEFRLSQVITNLLSNAVKFTPEEGKIRVDIHEKERQGRTSTVEVAVTDTGIGISPENQAHLFTSFEQADGGIARKFGGTGLGLAICKSIVEMMGGEIGIESKEGGGSTFRFTVKMDVAESRSDDKTLHNIDPADLRVLLIDDEKETRDYFAQIMREGKVTARTADSCDAGMALMDEAAALGKPYNIVFVDWRMPRVDGVETLKRIKQKYKSSVVVMISVGEWNEIEDEARAAGAFRFLSKPLFPSVLMDTINDAMGVEPSEEASLRGSRQSFAGYTILLVDDAEINREILYQDLADTKVAMDSAENGQIAVDMFRANPQKYDLILMDVHMDVMDGYEATRAIRALPTPKGRTVPIIAMTANVFAEDVQKCLDSGMNDHLAKPVELDKLFSKLSYYLTQFEPPAAEEPPAAPQDKEEESNMEMGEMSQYINVDEGLARLKGNKTIYKTLLRSFVKNDSWEQLQAQVAAGDLETAAKTAHAIKGMAGNLSFTEVFSIVTLLEAQLKSGFDPKESYDKLVPAMQKTLEYAEYLMENL